MDGMRTFDGHFWPDQLFSRFMAPNPPRLMDYHTDDGLSYRQTSTTRHLVTKQMVPDTSPARLRNNVNHGFAKRRKSPSMSYLGHRKVISCVTKERQRVSCVRCSRSSGRLSPTFAEQLFGSLASNETRSLTADQTAFPRYRGVEAGVQLAVRLPRRDL